MRPSSRLLALALSRVLGGLRPAGGNGGGGPPLICVAGTSVVSRAFLISMLLNSIDRSTDHPIETLHPYTTTISWRPSPCQAPEDIAAAVAPPPPTPKSTPYARSATRASIAATRTNPQEEPTPIPTPVSSRAGVWTSPRCSLCLRGGERVPTVVVWGWRAAGACVRGVWPLESRRRWPQGMGRARKKKLNEG